MSSKKIQNQMLIAIAAAVLLVTISSSYTIPYYFDHIKDGDGYTYAAAHKAITAHPENQILRIMAIDAIEDGKITRSEYGKIVDEYIDTHGTFISPPVPRNPETRDTLYNRDEYLEKISVFLKTSPDELLDASKQQ